MLINDCYRTMSQTMTIPNTTEFYNKENHYDSLHTYNGFNNFNSSDQSTYYQDDSSYKSYPWQSTDSYTSLQSQEEAASFISLTNSERHFNGAKRLLEFPDLAHLAQHHAQWMADNMTLQHSSDLAILISRSCSNRMGQNVEYGRSAEEAHSYLMKGAGSASRMLDSGYSEIGVGTAWGGDGLVYVCQVYRG